MAPRPKSALSNGAELGDRKSQPAETLAVAPRLSPDSSNRAQPPRSVVSGQLSVAADHEPLTTNNGQLTKANEDSADESTETVGPPEEDDAPAPATIVVALPSQAKLTVNNKASQSSSSVRKLVTPPLKPGKDFRYTLKAEMVHDGQTFTAAKQVTVRAGEKKEVALEFSQPDLARD